MSKQDEESIKEVRKRFNLPPLKEIKKYEDYQEEDKNQKDLTNYVGSKQFKSRLNKN